MQNPVAYTIGMQDDLIAHVHAYILHHSLIAPGDMVVVAVSGGADSLCLLHVLHALAPALRCRLHVAHLDHALRAGSDGDAAFVNQHAANLGLACTVERRDVAALARRRRASLETAARLARYDFLRGVAAATGAAAVATGHTRDDQAETLLLHLIRGSGLNGLAGMRPLRDGIIRPLLEVSHAEAIVYCAALGLTPRDDESNRATAHTRNRLRLEVLPLLETVQPAAGANVARAARLVAADLALIERLAGRALDSAVVRHDRSEAVLCVARWAEADGALRPHMLRLLLARLLGHADGFDERHYTAMLDALKTHGVDTCLMLPKGLAFVRRGDEATVGPRRAPAALPLGDHALPVPGVVVTAAGTLRAEPATAPHDWTALSHRVAYLNPAAAGSMLSVRAWRPGDRVAPLGMGGRRKLQDIFVDRKVPRELRRRTPVVEGPCGIAWVAGLCVGDAYRATPGAAAVRLTWGPIEP